MTDGAANGIHTSARALRRLKRRYGAELRFKLLGLAMVAGAIAALVLLVVTILYQGLPAFWQHTISLPITFEAAAIDPDGTRDPTTMSHGNYAALIKTSLKSIVAGVDARADERLLTGLVSTGARYRLADLVRADPSVIGSARTLTFPVSDDADLFLKGETTTIATSRGVGTLTVSRPGETVSLRANGENFAQLSVRAGGPSYFVRVAANGGALPAIVKLTNIVDGEASGEEMIPLAQAGPYTAGAWDLIAFETPEADRRVSDQEGAWLIALRDAGFIRSAFNWRFFTSGDSREPELAGIRGAMLGSMFTLSITLLLSFPLGVATAIYLEEFARKNALTDFIEVNINNLAAVPSIVFGLLGLAVFLNFAGLPRSVPLVGGLVLTLIMLPTVIIAARAAIKAVPPSIRDAALGIGASRVQTVFHHVLPLAMPGILTGMIIGMAHALGETAPLLMIGMVAFIADPPASPLDPSTVLPVQIFIWADSPERAFAAKTAAAIIVLLAFLVVMNLAAVMLRRHFERRW